MAPPTEHSPKTETERVLIEQWQKAYELAGELIAMMRVNVAHGKFGGVTVDQLDQHLKPFDDRLCSLRPAIPVFSDHNEEQVAIENLAVELRHLLWADANDMTQGAMVGCPVECIAFAKWWIQRQKGLPTDVPGGYEVFREDSAERAATADS